MSGHIVRFMPTQLPGAMSSPARAKAAAPTYPASRKARAKPMTASKSLRSSPT